MINYRYLPYFIFLFVFVVEQLFPFKQFKTKRIVHAVPNILLTLINSIASLLFVASTVFFCDYLFNNKFGIFNIFDCSIFLRLLMVVILFDIWMYWWHRFNHEIHFLWKFHRVHHTELEMDSTTVMRFHPIEIIFSHIINFLYYALIGIHFYEILLYKALVYPVILFHHSNLRIPENVDKWLRTAIVTPSIHRVHHSKVFEETNSNYGSIFSWWDKFFGTYIMREDQDNIDYGIGIYETSKWQCFKGLLKLPFMKK